jgi:hypothetical protein
MRIRTTNLAQLLLLPGIVTAFLWWTSVQEISLLQAACAWLLLCFPWGTYLSWKRQYRYEASLFAFVSAVYWLFYGVALFYGNRVSPAIWSGGRLLSDQSITEAMLMAVLGVSCLWAGTQTPIGRFWIPKRIPDIPSDPARWNYIRVVLALGTLFSLSENVAYIFGEGGRQLIYALQGTVPMVAFCILFRHYLRGGASRLDKMLLATFLVCSFAMGVASGWLGTLVFVTLACFILYMAEKRRPPWLAVLPILLYAVFFQAGKSAFRAESWKGASGESGILERVERWASLSSIAWQEALDDSSGQKRTVLLQNVVMRTSLLTQTANVLEFTPSSVPFQNGSTYTFLVAMWVPRALWPDKPLASEANQFYQVAYGLTPEDKLHEVSYAAGAMTEGYINFGWLGVAVVMYGIGLLFNWVQKVLLSRDSGLLLGAFGIALILNFIIIESQLAFYFGGLAQQMLLTLLVFSPIVHIRKFRSRRHVQASRHA